MIEFIIRRCINDYTNTTDKKVREKYSILGGVLGIICNLLLFAGKLIDPHGAAASSRAASTDPV